jgi:capsular polysaccharide biosynthesis protein
MTRVTLVDLVRRWAWLLAATAIASVLVLLFFTSRGQDTFVSTGTYVVRAGAVDDGDQVRAVANLSDATKIGESYAQISESELIQNQARDATDSVSDDQSGISVDASLIAGSNILTISVASGNQQVSYDMAVALGDATVAYVAGLNDVYDLVQLDAPSVPVRAESDGPRLGIAMLAAVGGVLIGAAAASIIDRIKATQPHLPIADMRDDSYHRARFHEEIARSDDTGAPLTVGVLRVRLPWRDKTVDDDVTAAPDRFDIDRLLVDLSGALRRHEWLHAGAEGTFTALLPGLDEDGVCERLDGLTSAATRRLEKAYGSDVEILTASCSYSDQTFTGDDIAIAITAAL